MITMDDCILMPPPAPRCKRPRINNDTANDIDDDAASNDKAKDEPYIDFFCVSPEDTPKESLDAEETTTVDDGAVYEETKKKERMVFIPNVSFRDIIGQGQAKLRLDEALLPLALPVGLAESVLTGIRSAPASILLHGPPGCGKTKLAQAVAGEARAAFFSVGPSDILSKFVGESEASIRGLFREARRKARHTPSNCSVIFFDEIDALGRSRVDEEGSASQAAGDNSSRRVLAELLIQMTDLSQEETNREDDSDDDTVTYEEEGGLGNTSSSLERQQAVGTPTRDKEKSKTRVIVVAATNRPEDCDPALLRRFAVRVLVALPTKRDRKKILSRLLSNVDHAITKCQLDALARSTEGWSGSDLESMTREAVMAPVRETLREAAILKKRASKVQLSGVQSSEGKVTDADMTRESLLNGFRNLRPVSSRDFEDGIAFFLGAGESSLENYGNGRHSHYDSSSDSSDEEVEAD